MVTIKQIAERVGKTEATVSLALNDKRGVSEATRQQIKEVASEMGYTPNIMARGLSTSFSRTVGLIAPNLDNPFFAVFAEYISEALYQKGYQMMLAVSGQSLSRENDAVLDMISRRVDGIVIVPVTEETGEIPYRTILERSGIPYVFATSYYPSWEGARVLSDITMGERLAFDYLLKKGHRQILYLGTNPLSLPNSMRIRGACEACEKCGLSADAVLEIQSVRYPSFEEAYRFANRCLNRGGFRHTAIATLNDIMAIGVIKALNERGCRVPQDVSLMGFDNLVFSEIATIPLSTVEQDVRAIAERSVERVIGTAWENTGCLYVRPRLILRASTSVPCKTNGNN